MAQQPDKPKTSKFRGLEYPRSWRPLVNLRVLVLPKIWESERNSPGLGPGSTEISEKIGYSKFDSRKVEKLSFGRSINLEIFRSLKFLRSVWIRNLPGNVRIWEKFARFTPEDYRTELFKVYELGYLPEPQLFRFSERHARKT